MISTVSLDRLLAASPSLVHHLPGIRRAAASSAPVLILGEAGSGRSALARAIHEASPRGGGPLIEVDAAGVPTELFESELFGHAAGAFTGAERSSPGRIGLAAGGALLLDHVEELPLQLQPKLLRLLAEHRFSPLGGRERRADVRFLAIAAEDLPQRARRGSFREDLFYRLEVLAFRIPPLRERRQDLPTLIDALLADLGARFERPWLEVAEASRSWMQEYSWPGNLRQLRNLLERQLVLTDDSELAPLPPDGSAGDRPRTLEEVERAEIRRALAYTRGHQARAAELLGISRKALWQKRRRLGLP